MLKNTNSYTNPRGTKQYSKRLVVSLRERKQIIAHINNKWDNILKLNLEQIKTKKFDFSDIKENGTDLIFNYEQIADRILHMPPLLVEESEGENDQMVLDFND